MSSRARRAETKRDRLFGKWLYQERIRVEQNEKTKNNLQRFAYTPMRYISQGEIDEHLNHMRTIIPNATLSYVPVLCRKGNQEIDSCDEIRSPGFYRVEPRSTPEEYFFSAYPCGYPTHHKHKHMQEYFAFIRNRLGNSSRYTAYQELLEARWNKRKAFLHEESKKQHAIQHLLSQKPGDQNTAANAFFQMIAVAGSFGKAKP